MSSELFSKSPSGGSDFIRFSGARWTGGLPGG